jgi:hypothetical protein
MKTRILILGLALALVGGCISKIYDPVIYIADPPPEQVAAQELGASGSNWFQRFIDWIRGKDDPKPPTPDPVVPPVTNAPPVDPPPPDPVTPPAAVNAFKPWHKDLDRGVWPSEWQKYATNPHDASDIGRAKPKQYRGWVRLNHGGDTSTERYGLRGFAEAELRVGTVNNHPGHLQIQAVGGGIIRWWITGDTPPDGPESNPTPNPDPQPNPGSFLPCPAPTHGPIYSTDGATAMVWGKNSHWKGDADKGPKLVLSSRYNGRVASVVTWWGGGQQGSASRWKVAEEKDSGGPRQRWYFKDLPQSITLRLHLPGGKDEYYVVPKTGEQWR